MSVRRNIGFGLVSQRKPKEEIARRVNEALALVRLGDQADKLPGQLFGWPTAAGRDRPGGRHGATPGADG